MRTITVLIFLLFTLNNFGQDTIRYDSESLPGYPAFYVGETALVDGVKIRHGYGRTQIMKTFYIGSYKDDKRDGYGVWHRSTIEKYEGMWKNDMKHGMGIEEENLNNPSLYFMFEGEFREGIRYKGKLTYCNGQIDEGIFERERIPGSPSLNGYGKTYFPDGRIYEGNYIYGKRTGFGILTFPDGSQYKGEFLNGKCNGVGIYFWSSGNIYEGDFVDNKRTGQGFYFIKNGGNYSGGFLNGKFHGEGRRQYADGSFYNGNWKEGRRSGYGEYQWPDGSQYHGEWENGKFEGQGTYKFSDGSKYIGEWHNGQICGEGKFIWPNGHSRKGNWENGEYLKKKKESHKKSLISENETVLASTSPNDVEKGSDTSSANTISGYNVILPCVGCYGNPRRRCMMCLGTGISSMFVPFASEPFIAPSSFTGGANQYEPGYKVNLNDEQHDTKASSRTKHECKTCHGSGREPREDGVAPNGLRKKYCEECHIDVFEGHYHAQCRMCQGSGFW